jgi:ketosteroid isomerase-like protein
MSATENKRLMTGIFDELAKGNGRPFVDSMADDFRWTILGVTPWSGTYDGKEAVRRDLLDQLFAQFADRYTNVATRMIAEDDHVVVECRGSALTRAGRRYANAYCYVIRIADGRLAELTEYLDTQLVAEVLGPPREASGAAPG